MKDKRFIIIFLFVFFSKIYCVNSLKKYSHLQLLERNDYLFKKKYYLKNIIRNNFNDKIKLPEERLNNILLEIKNINIEMYFNKNKIKLLKNNRNI